MDAPSQSDLQQLRACARQSKDCARITDRLLAEIGRLRVIETAVNTAETDDFIEALRTEAVHQRLRWGSDHDAGKSPEDWFWLLGYLGGKALHAAKSGNAEKALHHTIISAAALLNWHAYLSGKNTSMRPGIEPPENATPLAPREVAAAKSAPAGDDDDGYDCDECLVAHRDGLPFCDAHSEGRAECCDGAERGRYHSSDCPGLRPVSLATPASAAEPEAPASKQPARRVAHASCHHCWGSRRVNSLGEPCMDPLHYALDAHAELERRARELHARVVRLLVNHGPCDDVDDDDPDASRCASASCAYCALSREAQDTAELLGEERG